MGGPIVMEWKGRESIGCPDVTGYLYLLSTILYQRMIVIIMNIFLEPVTHFSLYEAYHISLLSISIATLRVVNINM